MRKNYMQENKEYKMSGIGILITSVSNFGKKGLYNSQEVGLAKALVRWFDRVLIFKLVDKDNDLKMEEVSEYPGISIKYIPAYHFGINGIVRVKELDDNIEALIHFSDTQLSVPILYRWCIRKKIKYIPYIGVLESHSNSIIKQRITNTFFANNLKVYRKCHCCVKTPDVERKLKSKGVDAISLTPVGLDTDLLNRQYLDTNSFNIKRKYGYNKTDKILLYIGRLIEEKQPEKMVDIFSSILVSNSDYRLLMVGTGALKERIEKRISQLKIEEFVQIIDSVPNKDIWELYRIAECFVNLNPQEIFGMAILEAMYYECNVVAWDAPGPRFIIENGISGVIVNSDDAIKKAVISNIQFGKAAHKRIEEKFTWFGMAEQVYKILSEG